MDTLWVGLVDVRPLPGNELIEGGGAYAYCAGHAPDLATFLARLVQAAADARLELAAIDWLAPHADLSEGQRASEPVRDVAAAAGDRAVVLDHFHEYPAEDDPAAVRHEAMREQAEAFVGNWIDGAVDRFGDAFELGAYAFVAELRFGEEVDVGWASSGPGADGLFRRAADAAG